MRIFFVRHTGLDSYINYLSEDATIVGPDKTTELDGHTLVEVTKAAVVNHPLLQQALAAKRTREGR